MERDFLACGARCINTEKCGETGCVKLGIEVTPFDQAQAVELVCGADGQPWTHEHATGDHYPISKRDYDTIRRLKFPEGAG